jgi:hypothetical protein
MDIKHSIIDFNLKTGSILVNYYSDEIPDGLTYNIDLPFDNGRFPDQQTIDALIIAMKPTGQMQRIVDLQQATIPDNFSQYVPINAPTIDLAAIVRSSRNMLLAQSDWSQLPDVSLDETEKTAWTVYRQELRDVTKQEGFPDTVIFPVSPLVELR